MDSLTAAAWLGFAGGACAFPHCLAMCGGFLLHLGHQQHGRRALLAQLAWLTGKFWSYLLLGALAGFAGGRAAALPGHAWWQDLLSYAAGGVLLLSGLTLLGLFPVRHLPAGGERLATLFCQQVLAARAPGAALLLGTLSALLPCPVLIAFLALAVRGGSVAAGMATMAGVGAGTAVPLLLFGAAGASGVRLRRWGGSAGGVLLVLLGLVTLLRGTPVFHALLKCPELSALPAARGQQPCPLGEAHGGAHGN